MVNILFVLSKYGPMLLSAAGDFQEFFAVVNQAQAEGRDLTADEVATIDAKLEVAEKRWADHVAAAEADTSEG